LNSKHHMSNIPAVFESKGAFSFLLSCIKEYNPSSRLTGILPHLKAFPADPAIKDLLKDEKPSALSNNPPHNANFAKTLSSLSKAISSMQKQLNTHIKATAPVSHKETAATSHTTRKTYSASIGNPALNFFDLYELV
jgi:hypothetical protein